MTLPPSARHDRRGPRARARRGGGRDAASAGRGRDKGALQRLQQPPQRRRWGRLHDELRAPASCVHGGVACCAGFNILIESCASAFCYIFDGSLREFYASVGTSNPAASLMPRLVSFLFRRCVPPAVASRAHRILAGVPGFEHLLRYLREDLVQHTLSTTCRR